MELLRVDEHGGALWEVLVGAALLLLAGCCGASLHRVVALRSVAIPIARS